MNLGENSWVILEAWLGLLGFDAANDILEPGHFSDEGVASIVDDMEEANTGEVGFDCFVLELLRSEKADELGKDGF